MINKVCQLISTILETDNEITEESTIENVPEWDSFGQVALIAGLEKEFQISFSPEEIITINSVKTIIDVLEKRGVNA